MRQKIKITRLLSGDEEMYQVDLILAMFAILLILLVASEAALNQAPEEKSLFTYRPKDVQTKYFILKSLQSPYTYRKLWIMKSNKINELNLKEIAELYLASKTIDYSDTIKDERGMADVEFKARDGLTSYYFKLRYVTEELPAKLIKRTIYLKNPDKGFTGEIFKDSLIYVWYDQRKLLPWLRKKLTPKSVPHSIYLLGKDQKYISINRNPSIFSLEKVLRAY